MGELSLEQLVASVGQQVRRRRPGLELCTTVEGGLPACYEVDELPPKQCGNPSDGGAGAQEGSLHCRLSRVLSLLVEHAAAAGADERVSLAIARAGREGPRVRLRFCVRDHAPPGHPVALVHPETAGGLSPALFRRLLAPLTDELGAHRSAVDGSAWWFVVTLHTCEPLPHRARVLVVDDNAVNRKVASHLLRRIGCEVDVVTDGSQAVAATRDGRYDLILMDCQMPVMDGWTATAAIRRSEGRRIHTPIVACTSLALPESRRRCLQSGMDGVLTKPVSSGALLRVVSDWVGA